MKRMNIPDELKRFTDPGPGTAEAGNGQEEGAGGDGADAPEAGQEA